MPPKSDAQLLREYAKCGEESAFAEIVTRHTNLVYSAALRQVDSPDQAAEVTQSVFIALARGATAMSGKLAADASLAGWLCRCGRNLSLNLRRDEFRRHSRERQAMQHLDSTADSAPDWERLRPVLDEAMSGLSEPDYDALVMRFFNNHDLRSVGLALGVSDDVAQKRVSRALDKLRGLLSRHGITTSSAALSVILSTSAVHAAPVGLAVTISTAAILTGATLTTAATTTSTTAIAMTTLQKTLIAAALVAAAGTAIYEARQASALRSQVRTLQAEQASLGEQLQQISRERDEAARQFAATRGEGQNLQAAPKSPVEGTWYNERNQNNTCSIWSTAIGLLVTDEDGAFSRLVYDPAGFVIATDWRRGRGLRGEVQNDAIHWANGVVWVRAPAELQR